MNHAQQTPPTPKPLYRSVANKRLAGVCGGIAEYFNIDATIVRLAWIVVTVVSGVLPGIVAYIIAALVMPVAPSETPPTSTEGPSA